MARDMLVQRCPLSGGITHSRPHLTDAGQSRFSDHGVFATARSKTETVSHQSQHGPSGITFTIFLGALPASIGVAMLKYRLYDIDVIINRTLVYGALTGILGLVYLSLVVLLQQVTSVITPESDIAVAGSTLAVAGLFRPLRSHVQSFIDRRFYRRKYNAVKTLDAFAQRLRDEIDLASLTHELAAVVESTLKPRHVSVWLRSPATTQVDVAGTAR